MARPPMSEWPTMRMSLRVVGLALFHTRSNITCSFSGTMKAQAHKMTHKYKMTANSSLHGSGWLNAKRATICTRNVTNRARKSSPPMALASLPIRSAIL